MLDKKKLFIVIAAITTGSAAMMAMLTIAAINMNTQRMVLVGIFVAAGLITSVLIYGAASALITNSSVDASDKHTAADSTAEERVAPVFDPKAAQTLMILQKKGRLIDFLQEDISGYDDKQIGHAIRAIHAGCREALMEYMKIEPVRHEQEGHEVTVGAGFDPSSVRLTGNVTGQPPFRGVLRHCGWRVVATSLPETSEGHDLSIVEPAEVEIL
ncbi:MAG: DUF2760 domain-containing protein [Nitrospirae bacterium]|nr:DUF2760 domain-containing protein [Nitrospirota bacterium]